MAPILIRWVPINDLEADRRNHSPSLHSVVCCWHGSTYSEGFSQSLDGSCLREGLLNSLGSLWLQITGSGVHEWSP